MCVVCRRGHGPGWLQGLERPLRLATFKFFRIKVVDSDNRIDISGDRENKSGMKHGTLPRSSASRVDQP